jgi:hypothetical protein
MQGSVTLYMEAQPDQVWALVTDVTAIGRFSPETFEAEWVAGATGPEVGARFRGHVKRNGKGPVYWTTCTVMASDPGREFAFGVGTGRTPLNVWRYHLEPVGHGTAVTESFHLAHSVPLRIYWAVFGRWRSRTNQRGMQATLERIKAAVEGDR